MGLEYDFRMILAVTADEEQLLRDQSLREMKAIEDEASDNPRYPNSREDADRNFRRLPKSLQDKAREDARGLYRLFGTEQMKRALSR